MSSPIVLTTTVLRDFSGDEEVLKHRHSDGSVSYTRAQDGHPVSQDEINQYIVKSLRSGFPALAEMMDFHGEDSATTVKLIAAVNRSIDEDVSIFEEIDLYVRDSKTAAKASAERTHAATMAEAEKELGQWKTELEASHTQEGILNTQINILQEQLQKTREQLTAQATTGLEASINPKKKSDDVPMFKPTSGKAAETQEEYEIWESKMRLKLRMDRAFYPAEADMLGYAVSRLAGSAFTLVRPFVETLGSGDLTTMNDLYAKLQQVYALADKRADAEVAINKMHQGEEERFSTFYAKYFAKIQILGWEDRAVISNLRSKLNRTMNNHLISFDVDFDRPLREVVFDLTRLSERISHAKAAETTQSHYRTPNPATNQASPQPVGDPMDLSAVNMNSKPRGPISEEERNRRRQYRLCMRCGEKGHFRAECPLNQQTNMPPAPATGSGRGSQRGGLRGGYQQRGRGGYSWNGPYTPFYPQYFPPPPGYGYPTPTRIANIDDIPDQDRVEELNESKE